MVLKRRISTWLAAGLSALALYACNPCPGDEWIEAEPGYITDQEFVEAKSDILSSLKDLLKLKPGLKKETSICISPDVEGETDGHYNSINGGIMVEYSPNEFNWASSTEKRVAHELGHHYGASRRFNGGIKDEKLADEIAESIGHGCPLNDNSMLFEEGKIDECVPRPNMISSDESKRWENLNCYNDEIKNKIENSLVHIVQKDCIMDLAYFLQAQDKYNQRELNHEGYAAAFESLINRGIIGSHYAHLDNERRKAQVIYLLEDLLTKKGMERVLESIGETKRVSITTHDYDGLETQEIDSKNEGEKTNKNLVIPAETHRWWRDNNETNIIRLIPTSDNSFAFLIAEKQLRLYQFNEQNNRVEEWTQYDVALPETFDYQVDFSLTHSLEKLIFNQQGHVTLIDLVTGKRSEDVPQLTENSGVAFSNGTTYLLDEDGYWNNNKSTPDIFQFNYYPEDSNIGTLLREGAKPTVIYDDDKAYLWLKDIEDKEVGKVARLYEISSVDSFQKEKEIIYKETLSNPFFANRDLYIIEHEPIDDYPFDRDTGKLARGRHYLLQLDENGKVSPVEKGEKNNFNNQFPGCANVKGAVFCLKVNNYVKYFITEHVFDN